ncbi:ankyrin repeat-containing domain protein [Coprinopsis sp. MPI-PUGE-AT-0042]|nr:ankyrin repeat-containing domain protein [Coprinopsis sp. MPI-PUGE-AT-0042]
MASVSPELLAPLSKASFEGDLDSVTRLLDLGVDYLEADASGRTALHWAVSQHHLEVVKKLLLHRRLTGPPVPADSHTLTYAEIKRLMRRVRPMITPLELAAEVNDEAIFKALLEDLEDFYDTTVPFNSIWPPSSLASPAHQGSDLELMEEDFASNHSLLRDLEEGADEVQRWKELTNVVLHLAVKDNNLAVVKMLLRLGANAQGPYGSSVLQPLHTAVWWLRDPAFTQLLLSYGADPKAQTNVGLTPLSLSIICRCEKVIPVLLEGGALVDESEHEHFELLNHLCSIIPPDEPDLDPSFPSRVLRTLVEAGLNVHAKQIGSLPPLFFAAEREQAPFILKELISCGADVTLVVAETVTLPACLLPRSSWDPEAYAEILNAMKAGFSSLSSLRSAILSTDGMIRFDLLLDLEMYADEAVAWDAVLYVVENMLCMGRPHLMRDIEVAFETGYCNLPGWRDSQLMVDQALQLVSKPSPQEANRYLALLRILDHVEESDPSHATLALFAIIKKYEGDDIDAIVDGLMGVGASIHHPSAPVCNPAWKPAYEDGFFDAVALAAIYGREGVVSRLLRQGTAPDPARGPSSRWHWLKQDKFDSLRPQYDNDVDAVLACLESTRLLFASRLVAAECPLTVAIERGDPEAIQKLISLGIDVNRKGHFGWRPLHIAVDRGHGSIVDLLIQARASVDGRMKKLPYSAGSAAAGGISLANGTALHVATIKGDPAMVQRLLDHGADVHATTGPSPRIGEGRGRGATALDFAMCLYGYDEDEQRRGGLHPDRLRIAALLLQRGATISKSIAEHWKNLTLDEVVDKFAGHEFVWDTFVAGDWDEDWDEDDLHEPDALADTFFADPDISGEKTIVS